MDKTPHSLLTGYVICDRSLILAFIRLNESFLITSFFLKYNFEYEIPIKSFKVFSKITMLTTFANDV